MPVTFGPPPAALAQAGREGSAERGGAEAWAASAAAVAAAAGHGGEDAQAVLARAFGWSMWLAAGKPVYMKPDVPVAEEVREALAWLSHGPLSLSQEELSAALAASPRAYLQGPEKSYAAVLEAAPEPFREPEALRALLLRQPKALELTHNCIGTCDARCSRCWRPAGPRMAGKVLDGIMV